MKENAYGLKWNKLIDPEKAELLCGKNFPILKEVPELTLTGQDTEPTQLNLVSRWFGEVSTPTHLLIEGDNLHSLACLCYTYRGQVNIIYIDPPYNTGKEDFRYNDRWIDPENKDRKSIWLSFMEKRLRQAKILLTEDGVIFISIDDNMLYELKLLCDNIFGPRNFVANLVWRKKRTLSYVAGDAISTHEYILCYKKNNSPGLIDINYVPSSGSVYPLFKSQNPLGKRIIRAGAYTNDTIEFLKADEYKFKSHSIVIHNDVIFENNVLINDVNIEGHFVYGQNSLDEEKSNIEIKKSGMMYLSVENESNKNNTYKPVTILPPFYMTDDEQLKFTTKRATSELNKIIGIDKFNNPKPVPLIKYLVSLHPNKNATVLDFFAGSGTTGHAVLDLNKEDGGSRQFILCTNNENNIMTDVCYPRIKKVMCGYKKPNGEKVEGLGGSLKFFKTDFVEWRNNIHELAYAVNTTCSGMLRVKENVYNELENNEHYEIYYQGEDTLIAIYKDDYSVYPDAEELVELKNIMSGLDCPNKTLYIFALDWDADIYLREEFKDWKNTTLKVMPMTMINEYKSLFNAGILKK